MVGFAGYDMPLHFEAGILGEHTHTREAAGLFDVSHMGQASLRGPGAVAAIEALVPADIAGLAPGQMRYSQITNDAGGIIDDLMITRLNDDHVFLVVNAARKADDFGWIEARLPAGVPWSPIRTVR